MTQIRADEREAGRNCPSAVIRVICGDMFVLHCFQHSTSRFINLLHDARPHRERDKAAVK